MHRNRILGIAVCVAAGALGFYAWQAYPWAASLFPLIVLILMVIGGAVMVFASFGADMVPQKKSAPEQPAASGLAIRVIASLLACTLVIPWLGFYTTCFVAMVAIPVVASGRFPTLGELVRDCIYAVITVAAVYGVFGYWLDLGTPQGLLI